MTELEALYKDYKILEHILEIIKKKKVNVGNFIEWLKEHKSYDSYSLDCVQEGYYLHYKDNKSEEFILTQEEFELLKEYFYEEKSY